MTLIFVVIEKALGAFLSLLARIPLAAWLTAALVGFAAYQHHVAQGLRQAEADRQLAEALQRAKEAVGWAASLAEAQKAAQELSDALSKSEALRARDRRSMDQRLRDLATVHQNGAQGAALTTCRNSGAPAVAVLPESTRNDLVDLAEDAQRERERLVACQRYITEVIPLLVRP